MLIYAVPEVLTHTYHPLRGAFRNVCHLPRAEAENVIATIRAESGSLRKPRYLEQRLRTEAWLSAERIRKLGTTPLCRPIYFFLGNMTDGWDAARPASITIPLRSFDPGVLTFTYPDSMTSCPRLHDQADVAHPCRGQVFTLSEIEDVVRRYGFPDPEVPRLSRGADAFIEVQVWDDRPLDQLNAAS